MTDLDQLCALVRRVDGDPNDEEAARVLTDWFEGRGLLSVHGEAITTVVGLPEVYVGPAEEEEILSGVFDRRFQFRKLFISEGVMCQVSLFRLQITDSEGEVIRDVMITNPGRIRGVGAGGFPVGFPVDLTAGTGRTPPRPSKSELRHLSQALTVRVPGELFGPEAAPTFDTRVDVGRRVSVVIHNISNSAISFSGALLGN
jgi:hypothetical protein